ncbi:MAG TPA: BTAD domain-containing putative transcriptional regulator [Rhodopila sp.]|nr:BTAD domain-containing putative transcriptional regulator [Rhodopila sp.]
MNFVVPAEIRPPVSNLETRLSISVLGPMRAAAHGRDVRLRKRKARALLAYLALTEGGQETRERLVGLLWSETEEDKARSSLRQALHELDEDLRAAGYHGLDRDRLRIMLDQTTIDIDSQQILDMAQAGKVHPRLVEEPFISESYLRDVDDVDPAFSVWARARRQGFHDHLVRLLEGMLRSGSGRRDTLREYAQAVLYLDPTHEEACRVYMRLSAEAGDTAAAQRAYKALWEVLDNEYDAEPSTETVALIAEIKQGRIGPSSPRADLSSIFPQPLPGTRWSGTQIDDGGRVALLVEPFGINGVDPDSLHLAEEFRHELMACLIRFREWFVVGGASLSAEQKRHGGVTGVYCVTATAYRAGNAISLVVTLREQESGIHIWSERFFVTLESWFESQQRIVRQIATSLNVQVSLGRLKRIASEPDVSLPVYDLWLRGQAALHKFSIENWQTAARMFTAAIQRAPDFAPGYSSLAQMNNVAHFVHPGVLRSRENEQRTLELARKAVALDPMDSRSQLALGWSLAMAKQYKQATTHMDLARQLNPSDSWTLISSALCLAYCGEREQATHLSAQAFSLTLAPSPLHWAYQTAIAFLRGDYAEAVEAADRANGAVLPLVAWQAAAHAFLGETSAARHAAGRFLNLARANWFGQGPPTDEAIGRWMLHVFPLADEADWKRVCDGVTAAGIPHGGACHHGW